MPTAYVIQLLLYLPPGKPFVHKVRTYKEYHSVCPSSELWLPPTPHPQASVPPPPCFWGEGNTRWRERGWESPNSDEGHTQWYSLYIRTLCFRPNVVLFYELSIRGSICLSKPIGAKLWAPGELQLSVGLLFAHQYCKYHKYHLAHR